MASLKNNTALVLWMILSFTALSQALLPCIGTPSSCTELQNQRCEDTDVDGIPDTCLCIPTYYLRITSCQSLPSGQEERPISPCLEGNPCQNGGTCVYNQTIRVMSCACVLGFSGLSCELGSAFCGPGTYMDEASMTCPLCPIGTYKPIEGTQSCTPCSPDKHGFRRITPHEGAISEGQCIQGPHVVSFLSMYGPIAGGTVVNITVKPVTGYGVSDITAITAAGASCKITTAINNVAANNSVTQCVTSPVGSVRRGPVTITINGLEFASKETFEYRDNPVITEISGNKTFVRGGKIIKIHGEHLNSVYTPLITITLVSSVGRQMAKAKCSVTSPTVMGCPTPNLFDLTNVVGRQKYNGGESSTPTSTLLSSTTTTHRKERLISGEIPSETSPQEIPDGESPPKEESLGERPPQERPAEEATPSQEGNRDEGERRSEGGGRRKRQAEKPHFGLFNNQDKHFWLGFELDGFDKYQNVSEVLPFSEILVYVDPRPERLMEDPTQVFYFDYDFFKGFLTVNGQALDYAATVEDYLVEVGQGHCNVSSVMTNTLHCLLPPVLPPPKSDRVGGPEGIPRMLVKVGNLHYDLGLIAYKSGPSPQVIIGIVIGIILVIVIITIVVTACVLRRRRRRKEHNANLQMAASPDPNIYQPNPPSQRVKNRTHNGYLQPVHNVNGTNGTPRSSLSGNSMTPLMIPMLDGQGQVAFGQFVEGAGPPNTPTTPTTPNVAYQIPRHSSIPFDIMDAIGEDLKLIIEECRVDSRRLQLRDSIGKGFFGKVYRGTLTDESGKTESTVAIKTIQGKECTVKDVEAFLKEAIVMKDCQNDNVLSLLGVVIAGNRPFAILPYMEYGDLKSYIEEPERSIKVRELLGFGVQVASGMEYLAGQKIVHRDLASRNCMINKELTVRIADFGLSRDIYKSDYYRVEDKHRPLPVKWMAIESLTGGVFTTSSDVWSFGVLLWELMTRGCPPYPDIDTFNLKSYLLSGRRLPQPEHAPDEVYQIMSSCWLERPEDRYTFTQLKEKLSNIVKEDEEDVTPEYLKLI